MPITEGTEVFNHPQMVANDIFIETTHPLIGKIKMMGIPFKLSESPRIEIKPAPRLGEHTEEVLNELGYSTEKIKELEMNKVVSCGRSSSK
jgi:crotonobetainyl-CoA:carnitine CoA-transferase CaiB-like acyl-CoA transferase